MTWLNIDINGDVIEDPDVIYCEECDHSDFPLCKPIDDLMDAYHCVNCDAFLWLNWTERGGAFQGYLLQGSEWDEGFTMFDKLGKPYPPY